MDVMVIQAIDVCEMTVVDKNNSILYCSVYIGCINFYRIMKIVLDMTSPTKDLYGIWGYPISAFTSP